MVNRYTHQIEFDSPDAAYERARKDIDRYLERSFKTVCMDYITLNFRYSFVGKLRKRDDTKDDVVDFVAAVVENDVNRTAVSMCRLHGDMLGKKDYDTLVNRSRSIAGSNRMYMMFSGVGFSSELKELAVMDRNIRLVSLDDIYRQ